MGQQRGAGQVAADHLAAALLPASAALSPARAPSRQAAPVPSSRRRGVAGREGRAVTNFGARAILALERKRRSKVLTPDEADLRLLLALETFPDVGSGRRSVGMKLLAEAAGVPY